MTIQFGSRPQQLRYLDRDALNAILDEHGCSAVVSALWPLLLECKTVET